MNRRTFLASIAAVACAPVLAAAVPIRLRVLSYNIHHGQGGDHKLDLDRIAAVIRFAKPDLVSLQEVDQGTARSAKVNQATKLAELTGMKSAFGQTMEYDGGDYGNAILSRFDLAAVRTIALPAGPKEEPRCLLLADISVPDAGGADKVRLVRMGATHLNHRNAAERLLQAKHIVTNAPADVPTLIAGDLNAVPESPVVQALLAKYMDATAKPVPGGEPLLTFPADKPRSKIDYVLAGPAAAWKVLEARVLPEPLASDHRPVLAVVELLV